MKARQKAARAIQHEIKTLCELASDDPVVRADAALGASIVLLTLETGSFAAVVPRLRDLADMIENDAVLIDDWEMFGGPVH